MQQKWFTVNEAAEYLRVSRRTIYILCKERALTGYRTNEGRHRRFKKEDLDKALKKEETGRKKVDAITDNDDPVLAVLWENELDAAYDQL